MNSVTYEVTAKDMRRAMARKMRFAIYLFLAITGSFTLIWIAAAVFGSPLSKSLPPLILFLVIYFGFMVVPNLILARGMVETCPSYREPIEIRWEDQGLRFQSGLFTTEFDWRALPEWSETKHLFIIHVSKYAFMPPVPKRLMSSTQVEHFRQTLTARIPKKS